MLAPPLGSINTFWAHLLSLLKALVKRTEGEKKQPQVQSSALWNEAWVSEPSSHWNPPRKKYVSLRAKAKEIVIYQLLKCISTKQGKGESGPGGTGRDHSAAQAAVLRQRRLWRPSILPFLSLGSPSAGIQQVSSPSSCRAGAKDLNYYAE